MMAPLLWDADRVLQVTGGATEGMFCLGQARSRHNSRCRWDVTGKEYSRVRNILNRISKRLPHTVSHEELSRMASLGLCSYHVDQTAEVVDKWQTILANINQLNGEYQRSLQSSEETLEAMANDVQQCRVLIKCNPASDEALTVALARYVRRHARIQRELEADRTALTSLQETQVHTETLKKAKSELLRKAADLSLRLTTAEEAMQRQALEYKGEIDDLRKEKDELSAKNADKDMQIDHLRKQNDDLEQQLTDKSVELESASLLVQGLTRDRESLQSEVEAVGEEIEELRKNELVFSTQLNLLSTVLRHTEQELSVTCQAKTHLTERLEATTVELANLQEHLREMQLRNSFCILHGLMGRVRDSWRAVACWFRCRRRRAPACEEEEGLALATVDGTNMHRSPEVQSSPSM
ncbi:hypothetical protein BDV26DRAFT_262162 [Aspergillus bertholletiae]|uniref:Uncharacterized protein n=1 Tax=Aspergillus bertholletiae TaxID=1226010 RepID=A0A5N7B8U9_9EURO|nr:hypothetical protein BDV26DRAFT_262162 [Aspergillus bertholletiae]